MAKKKISDLCIVVQARLGSQRVRRKMLKPFAGTTLVELLFDKLKKSSIFPIDQFYFSCYEEELKKIAINHKINIFHRSKESAFCEDDMKLIYEWHNKLPFKYVMLISACNPFLKIETIDSCIETFLNSDKDGCLGVFEKKTYYWDKNKSPLTDWKGLPIMNNKLVDPVYECAHALYCTRLDLIKDGFFMDNKSPPSPELFVMEELESFDIDYPWQFNLAESILQAGFHES